MSELKKYELEDVVWRCYEFGGTTHYINYPVAFWWAKGHETHRVEDSEGIVHVVPAPGYNGCVMTYLKQPGAEKVKF